MQDREYFLHHFLYISQISGHAISGNSTGNVLCPDLKSDISFYASAGNNSFSSCVVDFLF